MLPGRGGSPAVFLERLVHVGARHLPGRSHPEDQPGHHRHHRGEEQNLKIDADLIGSRDVRGQARDQAAHSRVAKPDAHETSE